MRSEDVHELYSAKDSSKCHRDTVLLARRQLLTRQARASRDAVKVFAFEMWLEGVHDSDAENHLVHTRRRACRGINDPGFVETRACMRADNVLIGTLYIK